MNILNIKKILIESFMLLFKTTLRGLIKKKITKIKIDESLIKVGKENINIFGYCINKPKKSVIIDISFFFFLIIYCLK